ncbi:hypothetical protein AOLI_G00006210 [Acnodon oligacanthus]
MKLSVSALKLSSLFSSTHFLVPPSPKDATTKYAGLEEQPTRVTSVTRGVVSEGKGQMLKGEQISVVARDGMCQPTSNHRRHSQHANAVVSDMVVHGRGA